MGDTTGIAWTNKTWNPWQGCHKVSSGCANCYMFSEKKRYGQDPAMVVRSKPPTFNAPKKWKDPALVFTCSWSDFFIEEADAWRPEAWEIIRATPHLTYQVLTKRPERIAAHLPSGWPFPNVWLGVTTEHQEAADARVPLLLQTEAAVRFVSCEPLVGRVVLRGGIDWVIVGGESGAAARPCEWNWIRDVVEQCQRGGVPVFVKQLGSRSLCVRPIKHRSGGDPDEWPDCIRVREIPYAEQG